MNIVFNELKEHIYTIDYNSIYYLYKYCSKKMIDKLDVGYISYESFICLKNYHALDHCDVCDRAFACTLSKYYDKIKYNNTKRFRFVNALVNALTKHLPLTGEWSIMCVPGSEESRYNNNPVNRIISCCKKYYAGFEKLYFNDEIKNALIRSSSVTKNHLVDGSSRRSVDDNKNSLSISDIKLVRNKNIILIDDITTLGITLVATRDYLIENGANRVIMLSMGKTI